MNQMVDFQKRTEGLPHLIIFTETEACPFMDRELPYLKKEFEFITVFPIRRLDSTTSTLRKHATSSVIINGEFADFINNFGTKIFFLFNALIRPSTYKEIRRGFGKALITSLIRRVIIDSAFLLATDYWLRRRMHFQKKEEISPMFYGFWFTPYTYALANFAKRNDIPCIARAHGYDIYLERTEINYFPFREDALNKIDHVFAASDAGTKYLKQSWPHHSYKFSRSYLGVDDPISRNPENITRTRHVVSCSNIVDVKRVPLIAELLILLVKKNPNLDLTWTHIGDGPEMEQVKHLLNDANNYSLKSKLIGRKSKNEIQSFYSKVPIDLFINLSTTEGVPVSIMEANSYGIPVLATEVGGNSEIVDMETGELVPLEADLDYIVKRASSMLSDMATLQKKRELSYEMWKTKFNSDTNYSAFIDSILAIFNKRD